MQPRAFPDKVTNDIDFTEKTVVQRNIPIAKNTFAGADNLQMITNKFWCEYWWGALCAASGPSFVWSLLCVSCFSFLRSWTV